MLGSRRKHFCKKWKVYYQQSLNYKIMKNQLTLVIEESGLEKTQGQRILDNFSKFITEVNELEVKAKAINITDISQVEEMSQAREIRLSLKSIRVNAENIRKELKEGYLRGGKAVDGVANIIKALIVPLEEHLEKQEKFAENLEAERKARVDAERALELRKYLETDEDLALYNYKEMTDEVFSKLVEGVKKAFDTKQEAIKKVEQDRLEITRKEKEEQERIRLENAKLKAEAEAREKELAKERAEQEKKLEKERAKARAEAEAREKAEAELKAKQEAEEKTKRDVEVKKKADELAKLEAERATKMQPEKEKLLVYAESIKNLVAPADLSVAGKVIVDEAEKKLLEVSQKIKLQLKSL